MRRTLVLKTERLAELTPQEMRGLAAAGPAVPTRDDCHHVSDVCIQSYDALCLISRAMYPCPTQPTFVCD